MSQQDKQERLYDQVDQIYRGMYGDRENKVPGLIDRQLRDEARIDALEKVNEKRKWWFAGFAAAVSVAASFVWHFIKKGLSL